MKIRISTPGGQTLAYIDALTLLYMGAAKMPRGEEPDYFAPAPGRVLIIEAVSTAPATVVRMADDRDRVNGQGLSVSEIITVPAKAADE